jgi:hypothetical protein
MTTPRQPEDLPPIIQLSEYLSQPERRETISDSEVAALALSIWGHPTRSGRATLSMVAEGSIGKHSAQDRLTEVLDQAIVEGKTIPEDDPIFEHFAHSERVVAGDYTQELAVDHTKILYAISQYDGEPQHRQRQAVGILLKIIHAYDEPRPPEGSKPALRPLN